MILFRNFYKCDKCNHYWSSTGNKNETETCQACLNAGTIPYRTEDISE